MTKKVFNIFLTALIFQTNKTTKFFVQTQSLKIHCSNLYAQCSTVHTQKVIISWSTLCYSVILSEVRTEENCKTLFMSQFSTIAQSTN